MSASEITLGKAAGRKASLSIELLLKTRLLVQANSGGGKSWLLRRLAEQLFGKIQVVLLDPEGEFATLREKFGYVLVGEAGETPADPRSAALLAQRLLELRASAVCDLYEAFRLRPMERRAWVRKFLEALIDAPKKLWHPLVVIVDEAHKFCPEQVPKAASMADRDTITGCKEAMVALATTGRKRAFCAVWATQRLAKLDKDASAEMLNRLVGMTFEDVDIDRASELLSISRDERQNFRSAIKVLEPGHFYALGRAISKERILIKVGPVETTHPEPGSARHAPAEGGPPTPEKIKRLLPQLADLPKQAEEQARSVGELQRQVRELKGQLKKSPKFQVPCLAAGRRASSKSQTLDSADYIHKQKAQALMLQEQEKRAAPLRAELRRVAGDFQKLQRGLAAAAETLAGLCRLARERAHEVSRQGAQPPKSVTVEFKFDDRSLEPVQRLVAQGLTPPPSVRSAPSMKSAESADGRLPSGQKNMLRAVAQYPEGATREQLSILTGLRRSTRDRYLQFLAQRGSVITSDKGITASEAGLAELGADFEPLPTGVELQQWWLARLPEGQARILRFLIEAGGHPLDRDAVGDAMGLRRSTRDRYIQYLQAAKVVEAVGRGEVRAARLLFES